MRTQAVLAAAVLATVAGSASAGITWQWNYPDGLGQNPNGGRVESIVSTYNDSTKRFSWNVTFSDRIAEGYWLAVSPGPNPKGKPGELALIYFDADNMNDVRVNVFGYNGRNGDDSYRDGDGTQGGNQAPDKIASTLAGFVVEADARDEGNRRIFELSFDASVIQNHVPLYRPDGVTWTGVAFAERIGMWFHPVRGLDADYGRDGFLTDWDYKGQGWIDGENRITVPTPGAAALAGLGALTLVRRRRSA